VSYEILFRTEAGEEGGLYFGSSADLAILSEWVETLPASEYGELRSLILEGGIVDTNAVVSTIDPAYEDHPPSEEIRGSVAVIADALAEILDRWPDGTLAILSDGVNLPENPFEASEEHEIKTVTTDEGGSIGDELQDRLDSATTREEKLAILNEYMGPSSALDALGFILGEHEGDIVNLDLRPVDGNLQARGKAGQEDS
jgi:hypothetical protein